MMVWLAIERVVVDQVATPVTSRAPVPRVVIPSRKATTPVGADAEPVTEAVMTMFWLNEEGFGDDVTVTEEANWLTVRLVFEEVKASYASSPPYKAEMECDPADMVEVVKEMIPSALSVPDPRIDVPSRKVTIPVGTPTDPIAVAVIVTASMTLAGFGSTDMAIDDVLRLTATRVGAEMLEAVDPSPE